MFDLDGTLVETAPEIGDAVNDTLAAFGFAAVTQQQVNDWIGHGTRTLLIQALASSGGMDRQAVTAHPQFADIAAAFDAHYQARCGTRSQPYPQVRDTLTALQQRGVRLALVTNKESRYTATVLQVHGLESLLEHVVCGDTLPTRKPDPACVEHCLARFGVARERALFVGDSSIDVATARNAGVAVWALPYGYNLGQPIEACAPDRVITDCSALLE